MKKSSLFLLLLLSFSAVAQDLIVVSDLDETLRQADVEYKLKAGVRLIKGVKPYEASQLLFQEIKKNNPNARFYYLSNSYKFLYNGKKWLKENGYPEGEVFQRNLDDSSKDFKIKNLTKLSQSVSVETEWLFFGDNVEKDPQIYKSLIENENIADAKVYIRDARLTFPQLDGMISFQIENQIINDFKPTEETLAKLKTMSLQQLVPNYLFSNLKKRLIKECVPQQSDCQEEAQSNVQRVKDELISDIK